MRSLRGRLTLGVALVARRGAAWSAGASSPRTTSTAPSARRSTTGCERTAELSRATAVGGGQQRAPRGRPAASTPCCRATAQRRCASSLGDTVLLDTGAPPPDRTRACRAGCRRSRSAASATAPTSTTLRDPGLGGLARLEVVDVARRPREPPGRARPPAARRSAPLALLAAAAGRRGSRPTSCCARCAGCAPWRPSIARTRTSTARVPPRRPGRAALARGELQRDARRASARSAADRNARARRDAALRRRRRATSCARR